MDFTRLLLSDAPSDVRSPHAAADLCTELRKQGHDVSLLSVSYDHASARSGLHDAPRLSRVEAAVDGARVECELGSRAWSVRRVGDAGGARLDAAPRRAVTGFYDRGKGEEVPSDLLLRAVVEQGWARARGARATSRPTRTPPACSAAC